MEVDWASTAPVEMEINGDSDLRGFPTTARPPNTNWVTNNLVQF